MAKLLLGKPVAEALNAKTREEVAALKARGVVPKLAIVRCGEDASQLAYERGAMARADAVDVAVARVALPKDVRAEALIDVIRAINGDDAIHGALLLRPLPRHLRDREREICDALDPKKDVDGMTTLSCAGVFEGLDGMGFPPCTPRACVEILDHYGVDPKGKSAVVIGRSLVVGRPVAMMLLARHATVTVCHTQTRDVADVTRRADIVVSAAGALKSLTAAHVRPGQVIVDVSVNWDPAKPNAKGGMGALAGDAVFDEVSRVVDAITPVPGGVGAVTTSVLMRHVVQAAARQMQS
ncbi:MAG: bifunctional 5,10-methylene-tetrahydrofolate dehydrogenase/5,10-methylene-tetrahydrofolate cyclohydrolase [Clostridia bacterium]|nr:bifunctional 5,10-methylene-tetrahydrofolate dehydrogenase/5,10-methylene-tetrahydrofolate cyclohydrolase [Clostridia bacterium]